MIERKVKVTLKHGLHARPSRLILTKMSKFKLDRATITCGNQTADMSSILSLLSLLVYKDSEVTIRLSGQDEEIAFKTVEDILLERDQEAVYGD